MKMNEAQILAAGEGIGILLSCAFLVCVCSYVLSRVKK